MTLSSHRAVFHELASIVVVSEPASAAGGSPATAAGSVLYSYHTKYSTVKGSVSYLSQFSSSVCRSVRHFLPDWNISTTIGWIAMKFSTGKYFLRGPLRMNPTDISDVSSSATRRLTFMVLSEMNQEPLFDRYEQIQDELSWCWWSSDFHLAPPSGQNFSLFMTKYPQK